MRVTRLGCVVVLLVAQSAWAAPGDPFGGDVAGCYPADRDAAKCEAAVTKAVGKAILCLALCHVKRADGKLDAAGETACIDGDPTKSCRARYDKVVGTASKIGPLCPPAMDAAYRAGLFATTRAEVNARNDRGYPCAVTTTTTTTTSTSTTSSLPPCPDQDGDGWTTCDGDCCDSPAGCPDPAHVNPGALEIVGNGVDDDCDPSTSDTSPAPGCSTLQSFTGVTPLAVAQAMEICQTTSADAPLPQRKWGLISVEFVLADGTAPTAAQLSDMQNYQAAILTAYGTGGVVPTAGATMAGISNGRMRDENDPGFVNPNGGTTFTSAVQPPAVYTAAHGGALQPGACGASTCPVGSGANDSINVRLTLRVPTNMRSLAYDFRFFSAEYQSYQCTAFNDYYLALLTSGAAGIPADHDISFDALGHAVSVNNGFFQVCGGNGKNCGTCPYGTGALAGTGMELANTGGGTPWLTSEAPVAPGETIQLEFTIFDVSDHILDSVALLDHFRWSPQTVTVNTHQ